MPRRLRVSSGGYVYHVLNRAVGKTHIFKKERDFEAFEEIIAQAKARMPMRILAWCVLSNHWHFVLWPRGDGDLSEFMRWLTVTHTQRYHAVHGSAGTGPLYQGRFKSFPVEKDDHLWSVLRYVERNPLRLNLVAAAADWRWSSLWHRLGGNAAGLLDDGPLPLPHRWRQSVQAPQTEAELTALRRSVVRGTPFGNSAWQERTANRLDLQSTLRARGRPNKGRPLKQKKDSRPLE